MRRAGHGVQLRQNRRFPGSLLWDTSDLYTTGTITVVPEPAVIGLLFIGAILTLMGRRFLSPQSDEAMDFAPPRH